MDRTERVYDPEETLRNALDARASRIWTCLPGVVQSFNRAANTCEVQLAINGRVKQTDGTWLRIQMPRVVDCPVVWIGGGGWTFVFDIVAGDECLVHFAARCIDAWWSMGFNATATGDLGADGQAVNPANDPPEFRMHNLSDGFAIVGPRSQPNALAVDPGVARLRSKDDSTYLEFNVTAKTMKAVFSGGITLNGVTIDSSANIANAANITGTGTVTGQTQVVAGTAGTAVHLTTHTHPTAPTGPISPPTPGS